MKHATHGFHTIVAGLAASALILAVSGCQTTTHTSVRTYEYSDAPREEQPQEKSSEWEMVSPGEMIVDPNPQPSGNDRR